MIQFFSKNFFARFFPKRYFQKTSDSGDATVNITGISATISIGSVTVITTGVTPTPSHVSKSGIVGEKLYRNALIKIGSGELLLSDIGQVSIITTCNWETDEEIIEIIQLIFELLDENDSVDYIDTDEEDIELILSLLEI